MKAVCTKPIKCSNINVDFVRWYLQKRSRKSVEGAKICLAKGACHKIRLFFTQMVVTVINSNICMKLNMRATPKNNVQNERYRHKEQFSTDGKK